MTIGIELFSYLWKIRKIKSNENGLQEGFDWSQKGWKLTVGGAYYSPGFCPLIYVKKSKERG